MKHLACKFTGGARDREPHFNRLGGESKARAHLLGLDLDIQIQTRNSSSPPHKVPVIQP